MDAPIYVRPADVEQSADEEEANSWMAILHGAEVVKRAEELAAAANSKEIGDFLTEAVISIHGGSSTADELDVRCCGSGVDYSHENSDTPIEQ